MYHNIYTIKDIFEIVASDRYFPERSHRKPKAWEWDELGTFSNERKRAVQSWWSGGPQGMDKVHSLLVPVLCNRKRERKQPGRVHQEIHDAATETMCSSGQHNEALSRKTWFECTSDGKGGERC